MLSCKLGPFESDEVYAAPKLHYDRLSPPQWADIVLAVSMALFPMLDRRFHLSMVALSVTVESISCREQLEVNPNFILAPDRCR